MGFLTTCPGPIVHGPDRNNNNYPDPISDYAREVATNNPRPVHLDCLYYKRCDGYGFNWLIMKINLSFSVEILIIYLFLTAYLG